LLAVCGLAAVAAAVLGRAAGGGPVQGPGAARPGAPGDVVTGGPPVFCDRPGARSGAPV